ncbi:hypothetical protein [Paenibacillus sp. J2TS4]|uniref:hypothetical protein n=1 Tax=Paenibacillus sp. J2TS4 TaxID=2807194 RepID=UPI001B0B15FB|nr:hypothetical protein [Paenibacillus sp. J2TS4]GIP36686.1 hypothetical protein J2TS4_58960 [Paenibacillus sp. J2TS4]
MPAPLSFYADRLAKLSLIISDGGGCTAMAEAGGIPALFPQESSDGQSRTIEVVPDHRIKSLVLLAPASVGFGLTY